MVRADDMLQACSSSRRNLPWIVFILLGRFVESARDISFQVAVSSTYATSYDDRGSSSDPPLASHQHQQSDDPNSILRG
jgi:hypothetical protein